MQSDVKIGVIGQEWVGKHYADHFEDRGFAVVRYGKEPAYAGNAGKIARCDITFIAVPTPTGPEGFDASIIREVLGLVGKGKAAVIKSTVLPGTTRALQKEFPDIVVLASPEFLREKKARYDVDHPDRTIVGIVDAKDRPQAEKLMEVLPSAPYGVICSAEEAELTKYAGNVFLYMKVVYGNMLHDLAERLGANPDVVAKNLGADPRIGPSHLDPFYGDGKKKRRGAGGNCFIKDFAAFRSFYEKTADDQKALSVLCSLEAKNNEYLRESGKDLDILKGVYGATLS